MVRDADTFVLLSENDMVRYRLLRRLIGPVYGPTNVKKFEGLMDTKIDQFMAKMKELEGQLLDLAEWAMVIAVGEPTYPSSSAFILTRCDETRYHTSHGPKIWV